MLFVFLNDNSVTTQVQKFVKKNN